MKRVDDHRDYYLFSVNIELTTLKIQLLLSLSLVYHNDSSLVNQTQRVGLPWNIVSPLWG
jgi:hypothetical protein